MRDELDRAQHARSMDALATSSKHFAATEERPRIAVTDTVLMRAARDFSLACEAPIRGMLHEPTGDQVEAVSKFVSLQHGYMKQLAAMNRAMTEGYERLNIALEEE